MTKDEAMNWIKTFLNEIDSQDNRATAKPVQFLLQTRREYVSRNGYNYRTETVYRHPKMESESCNSHEEAVQWLEDYGYSDSKLAEEIEHIERFEMGHYWDTNQAFLTEAGLKRHIEINGHNLRNTRDYVVHAFRNPEMRELFDALRAVVTP